jgi:acetolactate synthase I/II/III large subunit
MSRLISGAEIVYRGLLKHNVKDVFMFSGGSIMPLIDKFYQSPINKIINSHEQNCGHSATGYAKSSNQTGVAIVTSGPGITNMITPMLDATTDSTPLVVFSGQVPQKFIGSNAFQEAPATQISQSVTKWSKMVTNIEELEYIVDKAFFIANDKKKGAVHIDLPKCILTGKIDESELLKFDCQKETAENNNKEILTNEHSILRAINAINLSSKPILYLGQGCIDDYQLLRLFATIGNIPVTTTIHGCGIFDESHSLSLGWCGMHGYPSANYSLQEADCIIALGSRFDDRTTGALEKYAPIAQKNKAIIHVNIEPSEINKVIKTNYNFNMTCSQFLNEAIPLIQYNEREKWIERTTKLTHKHKFENKIVSGKLSMENVLNELYQNTKHLEDNVIITTGVGNHQMQTYQYIKSHYPKKILSSGSLGVMGAGLPYAVGAQIANPNKTVICIDGDSSFNMTLTDMKTIVENKLPVKIAIMNNNCQMMVNVWEKLFFEARYTATENERNPDFTMLAEAYGIKSLKCEDIDNLESCVSIFLKHPGPILCEFVIEKGMCLPLVSPGCALDEMILPENYETSMDKMDVKHIPS